MVLVDTSAWVEYLRKTGSKVNAVVRQLIADEGVIATTDVVVLELLSGARKPETRRSIWGLLNRCKMLPVRPLFEYEQAADLYVKCRSIGFTPANTNDLLIASVAIGHSVPLLAADADFSQIATVSALQLVA